MSFARTATVPCSTKRAPDFVGVKQGEAAEKLTGLFCTPIDPKGTDRQTPVLNIPITPKITFLDGDLDILDGDLLVVGGVEYPIRQSNRWEWKGSAFMELFLQEPEANG